MRKNKGITLIALIITIIIMLILVAVSVNILIKSNLIGIAEKATDKYKTASEEEAKGGSITINGKKYESIDEYINDINGAAPKLKYVQEGSQIYVYLKGSYYDCIASKNLDEKEQLGAKACGKTSIEEVIKDNFNNSREEFEQAIQEETGFSSYEMALNVSLVVAEVISWDEYGIYFIENVLKLKTDEEKEKEYIKLIKELANQDITIEELREHINEEVSNGNYSSNTEWLNEFIWSAYDSPSGTRGILEVKLIKPNKEEQELSYGTEKSYISEFNITTGDSSNYISENNTIKFTVKNHRGETSELLVPVNLNLKTFRIKISDTDIRTYKFIDGQTWEQFIGNSENKYKIDSGVFWFKSDTVLFGIAETFEYYCICIRNENNLVIVHPTDKIDSNTVYEIEIFIE